MPLLHVVTRLLIVIWAGVEADAATLLRSWAPVITRNRDATVLIRTEIAEAKPRFGSGFVLSRDGRVLTAKHVLPSLEERRSGSYIITGLVGWDTASIDFEQAVPMDVEYISGRHDLAVLRFRRLPAELVTTSVRFVTSAGDPLLVMGYPSGGSLQSTPGIVSGKAPNDYWATDAEAGSGSSGGPVFDSEGALIGMLLEGSGRTQSGDIRLGHFLPAVTIKSDLASTEVNLTLGAESGGRAAKPPLKSITVAYSVSAMKDDHDILRFTWQSRDYRLSFPAQNGYQIAEAMFEADSANHVVTGPFIRIAADRESAVVEFTLQSGPNFNQERGWLSGRAVTTQTLK
jgi:S1-C subfamily serine protease